MLLGRLQLLLLPFQHLLTLQQIILLLLQGFRDGRQVSVQLELIFEGISLDDIAQGLQHEGLQPDIAEYVVKYFLVDIFVGIDKKSDNLLLEIVGLLLAEPVQHLEALVDCLHQIDHFGRVVVLLQAVAHPPI